MQGLICRPPRLAAWWLALCLLASSALALAAAVTPLERDVKAAYLYKFATFVEWPDGSFARSDSALQIGVAGNDELADQLARTVASRSVNGHAVAIRKVRRGESMDGLHILFVGSNDRAAISDFLHAARGHSVLTVTDSDAALALGSMVNFVVVDDRLRFEVALAHVTQSRLRISARMLATALRVQGAT